VRLHSSAVLGADAGVGAGKGAVGFLHKHLRTVGQAIAVVVPATAISAVSGGALAGSLHSVTGEGWRSGALSWLGP
jgi:hypothetical protein